MNKFSIVMALIVLGFVGVLFAVTGDNERIQGEPSNHIAGEGTSGVTLLEYGDFQCPACAQYQPIISTVKSIYEDEISFQFRHFSLFGSFPNSMAAHLAAESAGNQGQFFEMHDLIYERQETWSNSNNARDIFEGYAEELELDMEQYRADYSDSDTRATINADMEIAREKNVTGTPTFFINDQRIENPQSPEEFFQIIDEFIEEETGAPSQNSPLNMTNGDSPDLPDQFNGGDDAVLPEDFDVEAMLEQSQETSD